MKLLVFTFKDAIFCILTAVALLYPVFIILKDVLLKDILERKRNERLNK